MACRWFDFSRHLLSDLACQQGGSHQSQCVGIIDSGAKAEIRNVDPRFTTGTCKALLSALGIWVDSKGILIDEVF